MLPKLEIDALRSDLAAVDVLLSRAQMFDDPIGQQQFAHRKAELLRAIEELERIGDRTGKIAVFFAGGPVVGSQGIEADFAGNALSAFQDLVDKRLAFSEIGEIGSRGPVPLKRSAQLLVTDVVRGSFGFVLEEAAISDAFVETELHEVLGNVSDLVTEVASPDFGEFEAALEDIDKRSLIGLRNLFAILDDAKATLRLVQNSSERVIDSFGVQRGRARIDKTEIEESETTAIVGALLGLLPEHKRFELRRTDTGETIYGIVDSKLAKRFLAGDMFSSGNPLGKVWRARMTVREIKRPGQETKFSYQLRELLAADTNQ